MTNRSADVIHRRPDCRGCGGRELDLVFALEPSPIGDAFVSKDRAGEAQPTYPIDVFMCKQCGLAQLLDVIDPDVLYGDYLYVTGSSYGLAQHFEQYAKSVVDRCKVTPGSLIVDLGSNDGTLLRPFKALGMKVLGVEPAKHIAAEATKNGVPTIGDYFTPNLAKRIVAEHGHAKVVTANNVFANIDELMPWVEGIDELLDSDGVFIFESFYLADLLENLVFDFIYHEHLTAFSVRPVRALFERVGLELVVAQRVPTKGGSLRYFIQRPGGPLADDGSVAELLAHEEAMGLYDRQTYVDFAATVDGLKSKTRALLERVKSEGKTVAGFGASVTGTTLIYHFGIGQYLDYIVDDNPAKIGRLSPGLHLPVLASSAIEEKKPDLVIVLAWRYADLFIKQHQSYLANGGQFVVPVPEFRLVASEMANV
jgi:hypothetical protein